MCRPLKMTLNQFQAGQKFQFLKQARKPALGEPYFQ